MTGKIIRCPYPQVSDDVDDGDDGILELGKTGVEVLANELGEWDDFSFR